MRLPDWVSLGRSPVPATIQCDVAECGLACVAMVLGAFGYKVSLAELRSRFPVSINGMTFAELKRCCREFKLHARAVKLEPCDLDKIATPAILHWDMDHFVVLVSTSSRRIVVHDPAKGRMSMPHSEVDNHFTGFALEARPSEGFETYDGARLSIRSLFPWHHSYFATLFGIFFLSLLVQGALLVAPLLGQIVFDSVSSEQSVSLVSLGLIFVLVAAFEWQATLIKNSISVWLASRLEHDMAGDLIRHMVDLPAKYFSSRSFGDLMTRFNSLHSVRRLVTDHSVSLVLDIITVFASSLVLLMYSRVLFLICVVFLGLHIGTKLWVLNLRNRMVDISVSRASEEYSTFLDTVRCVTTSKLFCAEERVIDRWQGRLSSLLNARQRLSILDQIVDSTLSFLQKSENVIGLLVGAWFVMQNEITLGMLFAFLAYKGQLISATLNLSKFLIEYKSLEVHVNRIADIKLTSRENFSKTGAVELPKNEHAWSMAGDGICFKYPGATHNVIDSLDFSFNAGESVCITGPSGCGKSTFLTLLASLYEPDAGYILYEGLTLTKIGLRRCRESIAYVRQSDELYSGSLIDNICLFEEGPDMDWVSNCLNLTCLSDFVRSLPMGLRTQVGDLGSSLSGGEKQRFLLARALYHRPRILILDEATSHLDPDLEYEISKNIAGLSMTRVMAAHRSETVRTADRRFTLQDGKLLIH